MANKPGYISVHRKIQDHWIWSDPERFRAWMDILLSAQFHDSEKMVNGVLIKVPRGSWFVSQRTLQKRWGWSRTKVFMFLNTLKSEQMVNIKQTTRGSIIEVLNYEVYQSTEGRKKATDQTTHHTTDQTTDQTTDWATDQTTDVHHTNKGNKGDKGNKSFASVLRKCTFEEDEIQRNIKLCDEGKSPFPNIDIENEYFRIAMAKREERDRNG